MKKIDLKHTYLATGHFLGAILLYRVNKLKFSKLNQIWHGSSPQIYKTYGENGRSVAIMVLGLWHFLRSNWPFYRKKVNFINEFSKKIMFSTENTNIIFNF